MPGILLQCTVGDSDLRVVDVSVGVRDTSRVLLPNLLCWLILHKRSSTSHSFELISNSSL